MTKRAIDDTRSPDRESRAAEAAIVTDDLKTEVLARIDRALAGAVDPDQAARRATAILAAKIPRYRWVGVYWLRGDLLVLGPYVGAPTEHAAIPVGRGVCGTAVAENANQIVRDVRERANYLACSRETRAEIVVLIRDAAGEVLGQIDVDGDAVGAFDASDEALLAAVAAQIGGAAQPEANR